MAEVTLEEMEAQATADAAPAVRTAADIKLDASDLPDYAGKTAADVTREMAQLREALRVSEEARLTMRTALETPRPATPAAPPAPTGPAAMTREQLAELMQTDPMSVMDYMANHLAHNLGTHMDNRFRPLIEGNTATMEQHYKEKYPDDFALFGDQINAVKSKIRPEVLSTREGWDDILSYVRGRPENMEKLIEAKIKARSAAAPISARAAQIESSGFTPREVARVPINDPAGGDLGLDATQLEIAEKLGMTPAEYKKWM